MKSVSLSLLLVPHTRFSGVSRGLGIEVGITRKPVMGLPANSGHVVELPHG